jgi:hypothetical protein
MPDLDSTNKFPILPAYVDTTGTSALTGISESTLEKQRLSGGGIPFIKAGRLVKYAVADIHAWMAARRRCSTSQTFETTAGPAPGKDETAHYELLIRGKPTGVALDTVPSEV